MITKFAVSNKFGQKATITVDAPLTENIDGGSILVYDDHQVVVATLEPGEDCTITSVTQ
jgi:hypothetical protein